MRDPLDHLQLAAGRTRRPIAEEIRGVRKLGTSGRTRCTQDHRLCSTKGKQGHTRNLFASSRIREFRGRSSADRPHTRSLFWRCETRHCSTLRQQIQCRRQRSRHLLQPLVGRARAHKELRRIRYRWCPADSGIDICRIARRQCVRMT